MIKDGEFDQTKWYEWETDMRKLSKDLPHILLHISGDGEDKEDIWEAYFLNGKCQLCEGVVTIKIPEFDKTKSKN